MKSMKKKSLVKTIKIDADKCNGCRICEMMCSAFHAVPKYSSNNPARSRIRVFRDPMTDRFVPVLAGAYTASECAGRDSYTINGKQYNDCTFCRAACPSREEFKEPDSGLPLKCDMCEGEDVPVCVQWCHVGALVLEVKESAVEKKEAPMELETGIASLADRFGRQKVVDTVSKMLKTR